MKNPKKVKMGKRSKAQGSAFELRTRKDLEEKGWICSKWQNNVEFMKKGDNEINTQKDVENFVDKTLNTGKLIPAKPKMVFNPIIKRMVPQGMSSGFPDFVCFRHYKQINPPQVEVIIPHTHEVIGVESKLTGTLDKEEKLKCRWLLDKGIFSKILVSKKTKVKNKIVVEYIDFVDIEKRMK